MLGSLAAHTRAGGCWTCVRRGLPGTARPPGRRGPGVPGARPLGATPSRHFLLKRFGEKKGILGSLGGAKGSPRGNRKISKIALVVQPKVNSSISPAADRSNGQETTAENKAPRCSAGANPARLHSAGLLCFLERTAGRDFRPSSRHHLPFLSREQVRREKERRKEAKGARRERSGSLKAWV